MSAIGPTITWDLPLTIDYTKTGNRPTPELRELYRGLVGSEYAFLSFCLNNRYVILVGQSDYKWIDLETRETEVCTCTTTIPYYWDAYQVGFARTQVPVWDVTIIPYKLFYSPSAGGLLWFGGIKEIPFAPDKSDDLLLYKSLLNNKAMGAYKVDGKEVLLYE